MFPTTIEAIKDRIRQINPARYAATRNYEDGAVTKLSPYISRGVISTKQLFHYIQSLGIGWSSTEKLIQELAWRDYWQQVWIAKGDAIDDDLKQPQTPVAHHRIPTAIVQHHTEINAIDRAIRSLYQTGYMHNHMRMYVAALACNIAHAHWRQPARWMYSHLLDGDWASNALSWQWVAGANANKKYYANQENVNRFFNDNQSKSYLAIGYDEFESMPIPSVLEQSHSLVVKTVLPHVTKPILDAHKKTLVYNYYNLDPNWLSEESVQRILLLEPSFFDKYPVQQHCIDFIMKLAINIPNIKLFVGEFAELAAQVNSSHIVYKEHPTNRHYTGTEESRDWMFDVTGYYPSFFKFWKLCKKQINA